MGLDSWAADSGSTRHFSTKQRVVYRTFSPNCCRFSDSGTKILCHTKQKSAPPSQGNIHLTLPSLKTFCMLGNSRCCRAPGWQQQRPLCCVFVELVTGQVFPLLPSRLFYHAHLDCVVRHILIRFHIPISHIVSNMMRWVSVCNTFPEKNFSFPILNVD